MMRDHIGFKAAATRPSAIEIRGVIFDLDDTLYDASLAYSQALAAVTLEASELAYSNARGAVKARLGTANPSRHHRLLYFKEMLEAAGPRSPDSILRRMESYEKELGKAVAYQWKQLERSRLITSLRFNKQRETTRPCFILTNENTRTQLIKWRAFDPEAKLFDAMITSEEMGCEKPDTRMFTSVIERFNMNPKHLLMVGDNPQCDLVPAKQLGMYTALTQEFSRQQKRSGQWHYYLNSLDDLEFCLQ